jgi:hypothetical protein
MKHRITDGILLVLILLGGGLAWHSGREQGALRAEYARLTRKTGELTIGDPRQVHILAVETGDPLHFSWRVYVPPNYQQIIRHQNGSSSGSSSEAREFIARVRFRCDQPGPIQVYTQFAGSSSRSSLGDAEVGRLLRDHRDKIQVEQLGAPGLTTLGPQESAVMLRLTLPAELHKTAEVKTLHSPVLYELEIGPPPNRLSRP